MKEYKTAEEHRAHVEGVAEVLRAIRGQMVLLWLLGRDSLDLDTLRDSLLQIEGEQAEHVGAAQKIEARSA